MRFISSGRLQNDRKGHDLALRAFALVAHKRGFNGEYLIAGTGPDETRLRELSQALGLEEQVRFLGWVEPDALADLYRSCHVLVHPSPVHDPFPNAVLEAMASGLAILGSDVSGSVLDRVEQGVNGLIHRAGDVTQLADHVEYLLANPEVVERMGQRARETALRWPVERGVEIVRQMVLAGDGQGER